MIDSMYSCLLLALILGLSVTFLAFTHRIERFQNISAMIHDKYNGMASTIRRFLCSQNYFDSSVEADIVLYVSNCTNSTEWLTFCTP